MNSVILIGRLTKKPELGYTASQTAVTRFNLAVDRPKKNGEDGADFPSIVVFGKQAENLCRYKDKGDQIALMGKIQTGSYKKDDTTIYTTDVVADRIEFLGSKKSEPKDPPQDIMDIFGAGASVEGIPF